MISEELNVKRVEILESRAKMLQYAVSANLRTLGPKLKDGAAEVSALLRVPVGVVRVLVGDLSAEGLVRVNLPLDPHDDGTVDRALLERVLAGLEAL